MCCVPSSSQGERDGFQRVACRRLQVRGVFGTGLRLPSPVWTECSSTTKSEPQFPHLPSENNHLSILSGLRADAGAWWAVAFFLSGKTLADKDKHLSRQQRLWGLWDRPQPTDRSQVFRTGKNNRNDAGWDCPRQRQLSSGKPLLGF